MTYHERLLPPIGWWVLLTLFAASMVAAVFFYIGPVWGIGTGLVIMAVGAAVFLNASAEVKVDDRGLRVGRAWIEYPYLTEAIALDADQTRLRRGRDADTRAYLVLRPYIATTVEVTLNDPGDPAPYWLISTRHPEQLSAVLNRRLGREVAASRGDSLSG